MENNNDIVEANRRNLEERYGVPIVFESEIGIAGIKKHKKKEVIYFECAKKTGNVYSISCPS